ncbi:MAG: helix-turn-helix domain-containing protein [Oscillospiraceae bacterium]|nr:helix-turn-helix domain-containing protein [Oscillospiraceae bacterium]
MDSYEFADTVKQEVLGVILKEQLLKEYIVGTENAFLELYKDMFDIPDGMSVTLLIMREKGAEYSEFAYLKNIISETTDEDKLLLCTVFSDMLIVVASVPETVIIPGLEKMQRRGRIDGTITAAYSGGKSLKELPEIYTHLVKCLDYCFYTKSGSTFINGDAMGPAEERVIEPDCGAVERALRCGDLSKVHYLIFELFRNIERSRPEPIIARTYCMELFVCVIRCCESERIGKYMKGLTLLQEMKTLFEIKEYIIGTADEIVEGNSLPGNKNYSKLTRDTLDIIEKNISNENLTLSWIAGNVLYTNVDYLGKVFKRETGKNFSAYVMEKRMEIAKVLIMGDKKDKIYEVAEKVGYGSNSQYFSQVFKKYTGFSPVVYKEISKISRSG